jgi:hypothetical protein
LLIPPLGERLGAAVRRHVNRVYEQTNRNQRRTSEAARNFARNAYSSPSKNGPTMQRHGIISAPHWLRFKAVAKLQFLHAYPIFKNLRSS